MALNPTKWRNIYSPADTPTWTLAGFSTAAYAYEVYGLWGLVATGTTAATTSITIPPPAGGWPYGSYRVYLPAIDQSTNFTVIDQTDSRFPPKPTTLTPFQPGGTGSFFEAIGGWDPALHGVFGTGPNRITVSDSSDSAPGTAGSPTNARWVAQAGANWYTNPAYADPTHPRTQFASYSETSPAPTVDSLKLYDGTGTAYPNSALLAMCANPNTDGSTIFVAVAAGSTSGFKITVRSPDSATIVETYDNLANTNAAVAAINGPSPRIKVFKQGSSLNPAAFGPTAIGNLARTRIASVSANLYADGVRWFEGPWNEPNASPYQQTAQEFANWAASVKQGAPSAKTMGPSPVSYNKPYQAWLTGFLSTVDRTNLDGIACHPYNTHNGDVRLARQCLTDLRAILTAQGVGSLPLWQTEQGWQWPWYGIDRSRAAVSYYSLFLLMQEQFDIPLERSYYWFDKEVNYAAWTMSMVKANGTHVLHPIAPVFRTLQGERHGKTYTGALDFGTPGNDHYIGNVYAAADGTKSLALLNCGEGDGGSAQFTVTGAATLTRLDCFGNQTAVPVSGGVATVAIDNTPTYLRVPNGVTCTPVPINLGTNLAATATAVSSAGSKTADSRIVTPGLWSAYYNDAGGLLNANSPWQSASSTLPQTVTVTLPTAQTANTAVIRSATTWQSLTTLLDFDVQTSTDGATFQTVYTYTKVPTDSYAVRKTSDTFGNSRAEQWDDERFLWRVPFSSRSVKALRLVIRACTPGGAIDGTTSAFMLAGNFGNTDGPTSTFPTLTAVQLYNASADAAPAVSSPYVVRNIT